MFHKLTALFSTRPYVALVVIFLLSVAVRLSNFNRPLSKHHEANAALVLINAETWQQKGPAAYHYLPVNSYHFPGDDFHNPQDPEKNLVINQSFGALWYMLPYGFFQVLQVAPSPLALQVYNLLLHFITLVLVKKISRLLFSTSQQPVMAALLTTALYAFAPGPLWFHGNGYNHEIAVLPFLFGAILLYIRYNAQQKISAAKMLLLGLLIFAGILCDWLMCFVAFAFFLFELRMFLKRKEQLRLRMMLVLAVAVVAAVASIVVHFSLFMGLDGYWDAIVTRYTQRGIAGTSDKGGLAANLGIVTFYIINYGLLLVVAALALATSRGRLFIKQNERLKIFIITGSIICLAHHIIFRGFTQVHDYAVVKSGVIISLLAAVALSQLQVKWRSVLLMGVLISNVVVYYYINRPGAYAANGQPYSYFKDLGEKMQELALPDEYVFTDVPEVSANLVYYSKRDYRMVQNQQEAQRIFDTLPGTKAIFVHTQNFEYISHNRIRK